MSAVISLKSGRDRSLGNGHPWVFSGAIGKVKGNPLAGETVEVTSASGEWLARGAWSPESQISIRVWTFDKDEEVNKDFFKVRIQKAEAYRKVVLKGQKLTAYRLINAEADGLPGLICDRYGDYLVCQFQSAGASFFKQDIVSALEEEFHPNGIYERSDTDAVGKEGLEVSTGVLSGQAPPADILINENGLEYYVDVYKGHKTGFYLDQRANRQKVMEFARGKEVLNCFSYTGGFGLACARAGATSVINVDTSAESLEMARRNFELNTSEGTQVEFVEADVFKLLRTYRDSRKEFDLIVLDPPKFIASASQLKGGVRGYKDINLLAFKLLRPGGILFTFSCSGYMAPELFSKIIAGAAADAGREVNIVEYLYQAPDHNISLNFPESLYLKGLVCYCP